MYRPINRGVFFTKLGDTAKEACDARDLEGQSTSLAAGSCVLSPSRYPRVGRLPIVILTLEQILVGSGIRSLDITCQTQGHVC